MKEVEIEHSKPGFNSFGLGDCKAPKVLGDIVESIAGAIFLDSGCNTANVWKVSSRISCLVSRTALSFFTICFWKKLFCYELQKRMNLLPSK